MIVGRGITEETPENRGSESGKAYASDQSPDLLDEPGIRPKGDTQHAIDNTLDLGDIGELRKLRDQLLGKIDAHQEALGRVDKALAKLEPMTLTEARAELANKIAELNQLKADHASDLKVREGLRPRLIDVLREHTAAEDDLLRLRVEDFIEELRNVTTTDQTPEKNIQQKLEDATTTDTKWRNLFQACQRVELLSNQLVNRERKLIGRYEKQIVQLREIISDLESSSMQVEKQPTH